MLPLRRAVQRRLLAGSVMLVMALVPVTAYAGDVDALWNRPQGASPNNAWYAVQSWWDGWNRVVSDDPGRRGLDELSQANADLLTAYTLLQEQTNNPGPHPVAVIDPLLSSVYNTITGSNVKAPIGGVFHWINQSLLSLEGRGSTNDQVRALLQDYRAKQAVAVRDLNRKGGADIDALVSANTERETAFIAKIKSVTRPDDGLKSLLEDADHSTVALAAKHQGGDQANQGKGLGHDKDKTGSNKGGNSNPPGKQPTSK
jgi:hypothetical protein